MKNLLHLQITAGTSSYLSFSEDFSFLEYLQQVFFFFFLLPFLPSFLPLLFFVLFFLLLHSCCLPKRKVSVENVSDCWCNLTAVSSKQLLLYFCPYVALGRSFPLHAVAFKSPACLVLFLSLSLLFPFLS